MTKVFKVYITKTAEKDISKIWDYISQDSQKNALAFIKELEEKVLTLSRMPERGTIIPEAYFIQSQSYRQIVHKIYRIIYRIQNDNVFILRVFHGSKLLDTASLNEEI